MLDITEWQLKRNTSLKNNPLWIYLFWCWNTSWLFFRFKRFFLEKVLQFSWNEQLLRSLCWGGGAVPNVFIYFGAKIFSCSISASKDSFKKTSWNEQLLRSLCWGRGAVVAAYPKLLVRTLMFDKLTVAEKRKCLQLAFFLFSARGRAEVESWSSSESRQNILATK